MTHFKTVVVAIVTIAAAAPLENWFRFLAPIIGGIVMVLIKPIVERYRKRFSEWWKGRGKV